MYQFIDVKIIADSICFGRRITTFELEYPRYIHAEIMTHRVFSRNSQSSRAVPVAKTMEINRSNPVQPIEYGKNKAGMSSNEVLDLDAMYEAERIWNETAEACFAASEKLNALGLHKQWSNRMTEWCSRIKIVVTSTEWENFYHLRIDPDAAQPEIVDLSNRMNDLAQSSTPRELKPGQWHMPYVNWNEVDGKQVFFDAAGNFIKLKDALKISSSCCAQVSYRKLDDSLEKAIDIYEKLFSGSRPHLSPTEHQAKAMVQFPDFRSSITHIDSRGRAWSGNLCGWIQHRQIIDSIR